MQRKKPFNIAIDGPAGAGKSTIAKLTAKKLGFIYVDTGAMYRAVALYFLRQDILASDQKQISEAIKAARIAICHQNGMQQVLLNGEDVSALIRTEEVGNMASAVSVYPPVREHLLDLQKNLAACSDVIMDGRDIGTCVLPDAQVKIFLTADSRIRAKRRYRELQEKGIMCNLDEIEQDIIERDQRDRYRRTAPLIPASDAVLVDSSDMTVDQVVDIIVREAYAHGLVRS